MARKKDPQKPQKRKSKETLSDQERLIGAQLAYLREKAGLRQRELSLKLGRYASWAGKVESTGQPISVMDLVRWCDLCGASAADFMQTLLNDLGLARR